MIHINYMLCMEYCATYMDYMLMTNRENFFPCMTGQLPGGQLKQGLGKLSSIYLSLGKSNFPGLNCNEPKVSNYLWLLFSCLCVHLSVRACNRPSQAVSDFELYFSFTKMLALDSKHIKDIMLVTICVIRCD